MDLVYAIITEVSMNFMAVESGEWGRGEYCIKQASSHLFYITQTYLEYKVMQSDATKPKLDNILVVFHNVISFQSQNM